MGIYLYTNEWLPGSNTLAYYPLATDTNDYSGNGRNGTNSNVTFSDGIATFNGSSSMVSIPSADWNFPKTNMTISARARVVSWSHTETSEPQIIVGKRTFYALYEDSFLYGMAVNSSKYVLGGFSSGTTYSFYPGDTTKQINLNEWNLYTITNDGNTKKIYVNGVLEGTASQPTNSSTLNVPLTIGNGYYRNHNGYFNGNISNVILEDKTRTDAEILDYYNGTKGNYGL